MVSAADRSDQSVRKPDDLVVPSAAVDPREKQLALKLIDAMGAPWQPERYRDTYREILLGVIRKKLAGEEIAVPEAASPRPTTDLLGALEESVTAVGRRDLAKAKPRPKSTRRKRREGAA